MQKILILLLIIFPAVVVTPQSLLKNYHLQKEDKSNETSAENPASNSISDIITIGDTIIWLGTGKGVSLSTDRGETWTNFYGNPAFGEESIAAIGFDRYTNTFWASTAHSIERDNQTLPEGSGLRYTSDNGITWNIIPQPLDASDDSSIVYGINDGVNLPRVRALPVTVAVQNLIYDIAFTNNPHTIWIASFAGGLRKSTDMGQTWQRVLLPSDGVNEISPDDTITYALSPASGSFGTGSLNHRLFSVIAVNDSVLYAGSAGGINKSTDGGISWRKFNHQNQDFSISGNFVVALGYNNFNNRVWAATWRAEDSDEFYGVSSSSDGGESWETFLSGERVHNFAFKGNDVLAPSDNGMFRSSNNGSEWILPASIVDQTTRLSLGTNIFYSAGVQSETNNPIIWLGSANGLAKLTNETLMWQGEWDLYLASQPLKNREETFAYPNPFSPKIDGTIRIKYSTGGRSEPVTIRIFDFAMNYVRTVIQNADRGNFLHETDNVNLDNNGILDSWDGRDDNGNVVPNGVYFYRIDVGSNEPVYGKIIILQ